MYLQCRIRQKVFMPEICLDASNPVDRTPICDIQTQADIDTHRHGAVTICPLLHGVARVSHRLQGVVIATGRTVVQNFARFPVTVHRAVFRRQRRFLYKKQ